MAQKYSPNTKIDTTEQGAFPPKAKFLQLPGEIRNCIFLHVLTTAPGKALQYGKQKQNINQLQHVCKQLRQETHHLELKFNAVIKITGTLQRKNSATDRLLRFLDLIPPEKRSWLRNIILQNDAEEPCSIREEIPEIRWTRLRLEYFCELHPKVQIQYRVSTFSSERLRRTFHGDVGMGIVALGWLLTRELSVEGLPHLWPRDSRWWMQEVKFSAVRRVVLQWVHDRGGENVKRPGSLNLRFFPMGDILDSEPFDTNEALGSYTTEARRQGFLPLWKRAATFWMENGI